MELCCVLGYNEMAIKHQNKDSAWQMVHLNTHYEHPHTSDQQEGNDFIHSYLKHTQHFLLSPLPSLLGPH